MSLPPSVPSAPSRLPWIAFALALGGTLAMLATVTTGMPLGSLAAPLAIAAVVLAIVSLARQQRPRWPAVVVIVVVAAAVLAYVVFATWAIVGFVQIMTL